MESGSAVVIVPETITQGGAVSVVTVAGGGGGTTTVTTTAGGDVVSVAQATTTAGVGPSVLAKEIPSQAVNLEGWGCWMVGFAGVVGLAMLYL